MTSFRPRVVSGMRPTGQLHLGHYFGALKNWVAMQNSGTYERAYFFTADWHALTTGYRDTAGLVESRREMVADWLAAGIDASKAVIFAQATIPETAELAQILQMITPIPWLERIPSYKEMKQQLTDRDLSSIGFLGYPVLQTADIVMYLGTHVPVGEDQLSHVELSRQIVRRFNTYYAQVFPEPRPELTETPRLPGLDGRKMSKSYDNAVYLAEEGQEVQKKIMSAPTDPQRVKRMDPGDPDVCNIFAYQKLFQDADDLAEIEQGCRTAGIGCVDCKKRLLAQLEPWREPLRVRRTDAIESGEVDDVLSDGNRKAREQARITMESVREAVGL